MRITEAEARRLSRAFTKTLAEEPGLATEMMEAHASGRGNDFAEMFARLSEGSEHGKASAAEERQEQREAIRDAVWLWMARVYQRCPRLELGEVMELKIIADQSGYVDPGDIRDEFEAFTFRIETTTTDGEF